MGVLTAGGPPLEPPGTSLPWRDRGELAAWLAAAGLTLGEVHPLPGDVSARRYFRLVLGGDGAVLAVYPPEQAAVCRRFLVTTRLLTDAGLRVPRVLVADCLRGWMLVEDLGAATLDEWAQARPWSDLEPAYRRVVASLPRISGLPPAVVAGLSPPLDRALLEAELDKTWESLLVPADLVGAGAGEGALREALSRLCAAIAATPPVPCHRDLTARNLVPLPSGEVALLDHQDLRLGPPLYDLASFLNDTLFPPPAVEEDLLAAAGLPSDQRTDYHRVAAQRTLKACGSYAAAARAGKGRRLVLLAPTLARALHHLARAPETAHLAAGLAGGWRPALEGRCEARLLG